MSSSVEPLVSISPSANLPSLKSLLQLKHKYDAPTQSDLPPGYKRNDVVERLYVWAANNFEQQVRQQLPEVKTRGIIVRNECGTQKIICSFIKPTVLPFSHLFDVDACAQFVSDFIYYQPHSPNNNDDDFFSRVRSPTHTLATQVGSSTELAHVLVSFLKGFGFPAFAVSGRVDPTVAAMDTEQDQAMEIVTGLEEPSVRPSGKEEWRKYSLADPPVLESKYQAFLTGEEEKKEKKNQKKDGLEAKSEVPSRKSSMMRNDPSPPKKQQQQQAAASKEVNDAAAAAVDAEAGKTNEASSPEDGKEPGEETKKTQENASEEEKKEQREEGVENEEEREKEKEEEEQEKEGGKQSEEQGDKNDDSASGKPSKPTEKSGSEKKEDELEPDSASAQEDEMKKPTVDDASSSSSSSSSPSSSLDSLKRKLAEDKRLEEERRLGVWHTWVYVQLSAEVSFFVEPTTGERVSLGSEECETRYRSVVAAWNDENYWLSKSPKEAVWKQKQKLDLSSNEDWVKFAADFNVEHNPNYQRLLLLTQPGPLLPSSSSSPVPPSVPTTKRLLRPLHSWLGELQVPQDAYELLYHLGQRVQYYKCARVEYFAPYLLKDGLVQKVLVFKDQSAVTQPCSVDLSGVQHVTEKFRHRADRMRVRETLPGKGKVIEKFVPGRKDQLRDHASFRDAASGSHFVSTFYSESRPDGLRQRIMRDLQLEEQYEGRLDGLTRMRATFVIREKKFGPADSGQKRQKQVAKVEETYGVPKRRKMRENEEDDEEEDEEEEEEDRKEGSGVITSKLCLGRILDTNQIMEKVFDVENDRILLKFHRIGGQILCKTVDFYVPSGQGSLPEGGPSLSASNGSAGSGAPSLTPEDVKVYMVDPRQRKPCFTELQTVFVEQLSCQESALAHVSAVEIEMDTLLETRMKELSAHEMTVWMFDIKRNAQVKRGRQEKERQARRKEDDVMDLDLDFLAPYLERYSDAGDLTRAQARQVRDECLQNVQMGLKEKEGELHAQWDAVRKDMEANKAAMSNDDVNSKKFLLNVLNTRLLRQKKHTVEFYAKAERKVNADPRITALLKD